jgi:twitching motility two-component system response regulator PilH
VAFISHAISHDNHFGIGFAQQVSANVCSSPGFFSSLFAFFHLGAALKKIMIVDDSPVDTKHLHRILQDAGYAVVIAISGAEAIEKAKSDKPDTIMMDINMPGLDGFATARKLGQDPETKAIPVIFVTSKDQKVDRAFAQMVGAKGYVTKPYLPEQILSQL